MGPDNSNYDQAVVRFGQINYINSLPLTLPLLSENCLPDTEFLLGTPAELNRAFTEGKLDLGAMSSFFFLEQGLYKLVPDISIASKGTVGSVLFFSDRELSELHGKKLAITHDSATSVNLLTILFAESFGFVPDFETVSDPEVNQQFSGALVIGDRALRCDKDWSQKLLRVDLGQWWYEKYSLPMVFGVWAANNNWLVKNEEKFDHISAQLNKSFQRGLGTRFEEVLTEAHNRTGLSKARLDQYYRHELNFQLTPSHRLGLQLYADLCVKHRLLLPSPNGFDSIRA
jgi:chorismate dehydratase